MASSYGQIRVTVLDNVTNLPVSGADAIVWLGTTSCTGLTQVVQTAQTSPTPPNVGVAIFAAVPAGSYCATASKIIPTAKKGTTPAQFVVSAGATTSVNVTIAP
ncbi:MAG: hypothetical protein E6H05_00990 [Bacillati bacterium ANGP1]|uniref:Carboxypeptidase regulatory-like domain-containing protein n=1 Tax=Candidatus Segetimicrobium genomatis TaxID=2569760 RepID=A0A537J110_9BACT|nr:MAG: hypothetical protein E6H05_00990 [Terrabacteria group bacterium ANGP1]